MSLKIKLYDSFRFHRNYRRKFKTTKSILLILSVYKFSLFDKYIFFFFFYINNLLIMNNGYNLHCVKDLYYIYVADFLRNV